MATSRYLPRCVDVIVEEEGSRSSDDEDFVAQEARISAEYTSVSRPKYCEGEEDSNAYGEAVAILDQAALACDQEFADHYPPPTTVMVDDDHTQMSNGHDAKLVNCRPNPSDDIVLPALTKAHKIEDGFDEKVLSPSDGAFDDDQLYPCGNCGRTFMQKALERHSKICEKVTSKKRNVFDLAKKRLEGLESVPKSRETTPKKKAVKAEDEFQQCPSCSRKFGDKAYDRHVQWCMEKSRRMQVSPKKDLVALAKLQARVAYRPKTPNRKDSGGSPSRKASNTSNDSCEELMTRSLSRNSNTGSLRRSFSGTKSLGRSSGISFLKEADHTKETEEIHFIRAATGRGSIKRGPAPTRASVLRQQKMSEVASNNMNNNNSSRSRTPNIPRNIASPMTPTVRRRAPSPGYASSSSGRLSSDYMFQTLVKPSVVRPSRTSYGLRKDPEGIESSSVKPSRHSAAASELLGGGHYDHSQEYDPYQSAARQMQELLFGTSSSNYDDLKTSSNSAFQKYVPASNVPSTADINNKLSISSSNSPPRRLSWESRLISKQDGRMASKVAKFCHECGNSFANPDIRFCCECGVKRLNC